MDLIPRIEEHIKHLPLHLYDTKTVRLLKEAVSELKSWQTNDAASTMQEVKKLRVEVDEKLKKLRQELGEIAFVCGQLTMKD